MNEATCLELSYGAINFCLKESKSSFFISKILQAASFAEVFTLTLARRFW